MTKTSDKTNIAVMANQVSNIQDDVKDIKTRLESEYVTKDQFTPVKNIVYGLVAVILMTVVGGLMYLLLGSHQIPVTTTH